MEKLEKLNRSFWLKKKILITGHNSFTGYWIANILKDYKCKIMGVSLSKNEYQCKSEDFNNIFFDQKFNNLNDYSFTKKIIKNFSPDIILHLASQTLVSDGYKYPYKTIYDNSIMVLNILESLRLTKKEIIFLNITSDKCYKNTNKLLSEEDELNGSDPYSLSKSLSELITHNYKNNFLKNKKIITVRAGNIIGGGDWNENRLIPDLIRYNFYNVPTKIRNFNATRPWQHVLEVCYFYLSMIENCNELSNKGISWNYGPRKSHSVKTILKILSHKNIKIPQITKVKNFEEKKYLKIDVSKSKKYGYQNKLTLTKSLDLTIEWYKVYKFNKKNITKITNNQIKNYIFFG